MKFYIQTNTENYITDCITYPYSDYKEVELPTPLPDGFIAGVYKYLGGNSFELDEEKAAIVFGEPAESGELQALREELALATENIEILMEGVNADVQ